MNNVNLLGRVTTDIQLREFSNNNKIANFSVAINDIKDKPAFIPVSAFGAVAENVAKYVKKGNQIGVSGYLLNNTYTDKEGNKRSSINVIASRVDFISSSNVKKEDNKITFNQNNNFSIDTKIDDEDIPF